MAGPSRTLSASLRTGFKPQEFQMARLNFKQQFRLPVAKNHFSGTLTQLGKQVRRQIIFTVLFSNAPHQQAQQPLLANCRYAGLGL